MLINESGCAERGQNMSEMIRKKLPIGIESFEEIRTEGFYYIDKTGMIRDLLCNWGKVNLFTRPRRFGKSLNMSMLRCFFEIAEDTLPSERNRTSLFEGLEITEERGLWRTAIMTRWCYSYEICWSRPLRRMRICILLF